MGTSPQAAYGEPGETWQVQLAEPRTECSFHFQLRRNTLSARPHCCRSLGHCTPCTEVGLCQNNLPMGVSVSEKLLRTALRVLTCYTYVPREKPDPADVDCLREAVPAEEKGMEADCLASRLIDRQTKWRGA